MTSNHDKIRGRWSQDDLEKAVEAITKKEMSDYKAEKEFGIPRRTLRRYVKSECKIKAKMGRNFTLSEEQNTELCSRIVRLAEVGYPITTKILRLCVYKYCKKNNITHQFSVVKQIASHKWAREFLKLNPAISIRKSQNLNPARAQKLNKVVVQDHFQKVKTLFEECDIFGNPERLFNMDEKGCRLNLHKEPHVLAKKGARRVHIIGNEHGENVTVVSCASATGAAIPPMILFKGKRMKPEFADDLPTGSVCCMTEKGSMTTKSFIEWLHHFGHHKPAGRCVLIFDGAKSHLDYEIVATADMYDLVLYCLPSNTTHELKPLDKAVFRSFEHHWDEEVMMYWHNHSERTLTKQRFGKIFSKVWEKSMTISNITSGFKATGLYPYDPNAIPEVAFAPSTASELPNPEASGPPLTSTPEKPGDTSSSQPGPSGVQQSADTSPSQPGPSSVPNRNVNGVRVLSLEEDDPVEQAIIDSDDDGPDDTSTFSELLPTPKKKTVPVLKRKPALNSKGAVLQKSLFSKEEKITIPGPSKMPAPSKKTGKKTRLTQKNESWFCKVCKEDAVKDMRMCFLCGHYIHEECVGLTKEDKGRFICPSCEDSD